MRTSLAIKTRGFFNLPISPVKEVKKLSISNEHTLKMLNIFQQKYPVFFINSKVDANSEPPIIDANIRLPRHRTLHEFLNFEVVPLKIKIDKSLRKTLSGLEKVYRRYQTGHVKDVTMNLLLTGLYGPNWAVWKYRSKINYALKQLPYELPEELKQKIGNKKKLETSEVMVYNAWKLRRFIAYRLGRVRGQNRVGGWVDYKKYKSRS